MSDQPKAPYIKPVNECRISGRLVRDPETKYLPSGTALCTFSIANKRSWKNKKTDKWEEETSFFDVKAWGQLADQCAEHFRKGADVIVTGRMTQEKWLQDGAQRSKFVLTAEHANYHGEPTPTPGYKPEATGAASDGLEFSNVDKSEDIPF